jgi:hypothetical protein
MLYQEKSGIPARAANGILFSHYYFLTLPLSHSGSPPIPKSQKVLSTFCSSSSAATNFYLFYFLFNFFNNFIYSFIRSFITSFNSLSAATNFNFLKIRFICEGRTRRHRRPTRRARPSTRPRVPSTAPRVTTALQARAIRPALRRTAPNPPPMDRSLLVRVFALPN